MSGGESTSECRHGCGVCGAGLSGYISVGGSEGVGWRLHDRVLRLGDSMLRFDFELLQSAEQQQQPAAFMACNLNLSWSKNGEKIKFAHRTSLSGNGGGGAKGPLRCFCSFLPLWAIFQN